jgi:hypothetical protein
MKISRWTALSAAFAALLAVSLYSCYSFIRMPTTQSSNVVDLQYTQTVEYSYTALVKPSLLYDNRMEISTGEPLYLKLVEQLDITLNYSLTQTPKTVEMTDTVLRYEATAALSGGDWTKTYSLGPRGSRPISFTESYTLDIEEIQGIVDTIGEETGTRIPAYTYEIRPLIRLTASAGLKPIEEEFTPTLTIKFGGGKIEFEGLRSTRTGAVTHRETETATLGLPGSSATVGAMKAASIITSISLAVLLAMSTKFTLQERASRPFLERLSGDVRDRIIEATEPPDRIERATVKVGSLEDLARVSEEAFKPIIQHGDVFYVLDGYIRYEFSIKRGDERDV